jgi:hypothetical protein
MNALVLKWLTSGIVCLLVCSAIWLAGSLRPKPGDLRYRLAAVSGPAQSLADMERGSMPAVYAADYAASAAMRRVAQLR